MKKSTLVWVIIIILIAIGGIWYINRNQTTSSTPTPTPQQTTTQKTNPITTTSTTNLVEQKTIVIENLTFTPNTVTISAGSTVTWTNNDPMSHSVIGDNGGPKSTTLSNGQSYSYTFNTPGTYTYHCGIHPSMKGTVVVQ